MKHWNWDSQEELESFTNELDLIEYLMENAPDLFGSVLPRVVAIVSKPLDWDRMLVTELLGEEMSHVNEESMWAAFLWRKRSGKCYLKQG